MMTVSSQYSRLVLHQVKVKGSHGFSSHTGMADAAPESIVCQVVMNMKY